MYALVARLSALAGVVFPVAAIAQPAREPIYGHPMWDGGGHLWFAGPLMMILFFAIAVALIVFLVRWLGGAQRHGSGRHTPADPALGILRARFARGEIDKQEYEQRRDILAP